MEYSAKSIVTSKTIPIFALEKNNPLKHLQL